MSQRSPSQQTTIRDAVPSTTRSGKIVDRFCESVRKHLGIQVRDIQIEAALHLRDSVIVEMATGEGKTLTTALAACLLRDLNSTVCVATANDYLACRDANWMREVLAEMGHHATSLGEISAYEGNVVYGTIRGFGFDHLRRRIANRSAGGADPLRQDVLIVDEADSVLIDEARTPLVISQRDNEVDEASAACHYWAADTARAFVEDVDFVRIQPSEEIALTPTGHGKLIHAAMPTAMNGLNMTQITYALEQAIWVRAKLRAEQHYLVRDGKVVLIQEFTGRTAENRTFASGIHQAIEAGEGLRLTPPSQDIARITVQSFVARFRHVCGLTATANEDARELQQVYNVSVVKVATHQPSQLTILSPEVCTNADDKRERIAAETREMIAIGRAVLIGARSIEASESLSQVLSRHDIKHVVLNAKNPQAEADVVAAAGQVSKVTVATNMAGRGTDIPLSTEVRSAGGLHVIVSEAHSAARIDRQFMGRAGRQGDPGSARMYVSPDDEVLRQAFGNQRRHDVAAQVKKAQAKISKEHQLDRSRLTAHETSVAQSLAKIGLDSVLDPLP